MNKEEDCEWAGLLPYLLFPMWELQRASNGFSCLSVGLREPCCGLLNMVKRDM